MPVARQIMGHVWGYLKSLGVSPPGRDEAVTATEVSTASMAGTTEVLAEIEPDEGDDLPSEEDPAPSLLPSLPVVPTSAPVAPSAAPVLPSPLPVLASPAPEDRSRPSVAAAPLPVASSSPSAPPETSPAIVSPEGPPPELVGPSLEDMPEEGDVSGDEMYRY